MLPGFSPRLYRSKAIRAVNSPQPVKRVFITGLALQAPDVGALHRKKIGDLMLRQRGERFAIRGVW